jgi:hypothetical protein
MKLLIGLTIVFIILVSSNFIKAFINEKEGLTMWIKNEGPLPGGSWKNSCRQNSPYMTFIKWYKDKNDPTQCKLSADCRDERGRYRTTSSIIGKCGEKYKNVNGVLTIE